MKFIFSACILFGNLAAQSAALAQSSMLRVACEGNDVGAEISINGKFKGECPLDIQVGPGTMQLRMVKKVDTLRERVFEQDIRMGEGVVKKIEARLGVAQLTAEGQRMDAERARLAAETQRREQETARIREAERQRQLAQAEQQRRDRLARAAADFKAEGIEAGTGKSFRDCAECPEMVWIPSGQLPQRDAGANPTVGWLNQVNIAYPLAVGKFELTYDEWDACAAEGACSKKPEGLTAEMFSTTHWGRGRQPVIYVSRPEVLVYLAWLSKKTGQDYRLLSFAEFVYAARAGSMTKLPWGDELGSNNANCKNCGSRWDGKQPAPVGSFKPNSWGLHDMIGNVDEMVADCGRASLSYGAAPTDGSPILINCAVTSPSESRKLLGDSFLMLGGNWNEEGGQGIVVNSFYENRSGFTLGLRVARTFQAKAPDGEKVK